MTNGYVLVDCKGLNLLGGDTPQSISGLYKSVKTAFESGKPIYAVNCVYGTGVTVSPVQVMGILEAGVYILTASILQVRVSSNDTAIITSLLT